MNYLPYEILEYIVKFINDPRDVSNLRTTNNLFNKLLTERCETIRENKKVNYNEIERDWSKISRNHSLNMNFVLSFKRLQKVDIPIHISNYSCLSVIGMLQYLKRVNLRLDYSFDINLLYNFFKDYRNGYVLINGTLQKQKRDLRNILFKIIRKRTIRWISDEKYGLIDLENPRRLSFIDLNLIRLVNTKTLITNAPREAIMDDLNIETVIIPIPLNELTEIDFIPWLRAKNYIYQPVKPRKRNPVNLELLSFKALSNFQEIRPQIKSYIFPIHPLDLPKINECFINIQSIGIYIENSKWDGLIRRYCDGKKLTVFQEENLKSYGENLDNFPYQEDYIDSIFF